MRVLNYPVAMSGERSYLPPMKVPRVDRAEGALRVAINFVFGMPFLWTLLVAVRGPLWWGSHRVFGDGVGRYSTLAWVMVVALGAIWLGVSLLFSSTLARRVAGSGSILIGGALIVAFHP